jgi:UDP:flavonoid glycosyltransferase YjiC (YdhE family)
MRVLLACSLGGSGHLEPILAVARAARRLGHETVVLISPSLVREIEQTGLE